MLTPLERATQPNQYDREDLAWAQEGRTESVRTQLFWDYLKPYVQNWRGKSILDVGAGTGWLLAHALKYGAHKAVGVEPSKKNIAQGKQDHPDVELVQSAFEDFDSSDRFDEIVAVMSFSHIADLDAAFKKVHTLLRPNGKAIVIVPDYDYFQTKRHDYEVTTQAIDDDSYAVAITRPSGTLADVVRKSSVYQKAAESAGLVLAEDKPMKPTKKQIALAPKYAAVKDKALCRFLLFTVVSK